jgi:hypothetical protein
MGDKHSLDPPAPDNVVSIDDVLQDLVERMTCLSAEFKGELDRLDRLTHM